MRKKPKEKTKSRKQNSEKTEIGKTDSLDSYVKMITIISLIFGIVFTCVLSNQIVQPLFAPRIEEMKITPLYVEKFNQDYDYLLVYRVEYVIDAPLIPIYNNLKLKIPGYIDEERGDIRGDTYLLGSFYEHNPYINIPTEYRNLTTTVSLEKQNGEIEIKLNTGILDTKRISAVLYCAEPVNLHETSINFPHHYWWNLQHISPIYQYEIATNLQDLGYTNLIYDNNKSRPFDIWELKIANLNELELREYRYAMDNENDIRVCHNGIEWNIVGECASNQEFCISVDLMPKETKTFLILRHKQYTDNELNLFNITYFSCAEIWNQVMKQKI